MFHLYILRKNKSKRNVFIKNWWLLLRHASTLWVTRSVAAALVHPTARDMYANERASPRLAPMDCLCVDELIDRYIDWLNLFIYIYIYIYIHIYRYVCIYLFLASTARRRVSRITAHPLYIHAVANCVILAIAGRLISRAWRHDCIHVRLKYINCTFCM